MWSSSPTYIFALISYRLARGRTLPEKHFASSAQHPSQDKINVNSDLCYSSKLLRPWLTLVAEVVLERAVGDAAAVRKLADRLLSLRQQPSQARAYGDRSWLDMAESELSVLTTQCLDRRIADKQTLIEEVAAWERSRNQKHAKTDWQFTAADARVKLKRLYHVI
jgi:hypothetical protein